MNRRERRAAAKSGRGPAAYPRGVPPANALFGEALRHYEAGRLQQAHAICLQIQQLNPNDVDALHLDGMIACLAGFWPASVNLLTRAVRLSGRDPTLHHNVAQALAHVGRLDEAITHYEQAIALQPRYPSALGNLANLLLQQEKLERAADTYLKLLAISPSQPVIENNLGTALQRLNRYDEAFAAF